ncbi:hypothetical protein L9F63_013573, partial [Diploptera punctata]
HQSWMRPAYWLHEESGCLWCVWWGMDSLALSLFITGKTSPSPTVLLPAAEVSFQGLSCILNIMNRVTGAQVDEQLCNASERPEHKMVECNTHRCPAKWFEDEWGPCSVSCGGGSRFRQVHCAEEGNGTRYKRIASRIRVAVNIAFFHLRHSHRCFKDKLKMVSTLFLFLKYSRHFSP